MVRTMLGTSHLTLLGCWVGVLLVTLGCTSAQVETVANALQNGVEVTAIEQVPVLQWQAEVGAGASVPVVVGNVVVGASDRAVTAFEPTTGAVVWQFVPDGGVWPRSLTARDDILFVGVLGGVVALDSRGGEMLWQQETVGEVLWPPLVAQDALFVGTAYVGPGVKPEPDKDAWLYAFAVDSGEKLWAVETAVYTLVTPAVNENIVIAGGSFLSDVDIEEGGFLRLHAFDRNNGELIWQTERVDGFLKSLAVDQERVYFLAYTDMLYGLDLADGRELWRYPTENWSPGFTFADGILYLGSDNAFVHAVDGATGTAVWRVHQEGVFNAPRSEPLISGDFLYFQNNDNRLYALHKLDGRLLWQSEPQSRSRVSLSIGFGYLYLVDQSGILNTFQ